MAFAFTVIVDSKDPSVLDKIRAAVAAAAADWGSYISGAGSIEIAVSVDPAAFANHPAGIAATTPGDGVSISGKAVSTDGARTVFEAASTYELRTGIDITPNGADISIKVNPAQLSNLWFSGDATSLATSGHYDAVSVFRHELGHGLGLTSYRNPDSGLLPSDKELVWDSWVGENTVTHTAQFLGPNATLQHGSWVNLTPKQFSHVGADSSDPLAQDLMGGFGLPKGNTVQISALDLALLADVTTAVTFRDIDKASLSMAGTEANGASGNASISSDGRFIAFQSSASDLVTGDTNGASDIFVYDRVHNTTQRFSVGAGGTQSNGVSADPSIDQTGMFVAFDSTATNLVTGDMAGWQEVFVTSGANTVRVSMGRNAQGVNNAEPDWPSFHPVITSTSSVNYLVAYVSQAGNLVANDSRSDGKIFLYNSATHTITKISNGIGGQVNGASDFPSISANGGIIAFESVASNLVANDTNVKDIFFYNGSTLKRIDRAGIQPDGASSNASVSADGNFIAFQSTASNLVLDDTNGFSDIFVYDRPNNKIERVSLTSSGLQADNDSFAPSISSDGRFVTFSSRAQNLVPGSSSNATDVFVYDRTMHAMKLLSVNAGDIPGNSDSAAPKISADGNYVAFESNASNLVGKDPTNLLDVFVTNAHQFFTNGGTGDDVMGASTADETLNGGGGTNTVSYASVSAPVTVNLATTGPQNTGGAGTDTLTNFANIIGGSGADRLTGDSMANSLSGGPGNDILNGGAGFDLLTGGAGNDKFLFDLAALTDAKAPTPVFDEVKDFASGDQIDLTALLSTAYNHGSGEAVSSLVRAIEDASGTFANLQVDTDGTSNGANWTTIARLDGIQAHNILNIILDSTLPGGSAISVSNAPGTPFFAQPTFELAAFAPGAGGWTDQNQYPREVADVNGDHLADIVGFGADGVIVSLAAGNGHFASPVAGIQNFGFLANGGGWTSDNQYPRQLADVNGDHMADIVGFGADGVIVSLATGNGHFASPIAGIQNFGFLANGGGWVSEDQYPRQLADVNGDGMADIVGFGADGVIVSLATGNGHFASPVAGIQNFGFLANGGGWSSENQYPRQLADVNGDGMADIVGFGADGATVSLATGNGHFASPVAGIQNFGFLAAGGGWTSQDLYPRALGDVNGDGAADIIGFGHDGVFEALSNGFHLI
jgi:hypothetical protein